MKKVNCSGNDSLPLLLCSNGVIVMAEADTDVSEETTAEAESDGIDEAAEAADTGISLSCL